MKNHHNLSFALCLWAGSAFAQQLGTIQQYHLAPAEEMQRFGVPWVVDGKGLVKGFAPVKGKEPARGIDFKLALDGSGTITEERWMNREKLEGEVGATTIKKGDRVRRLAFLLWDKASGTVELAHQLYDREARQYEGPRVKLGNVPLDAKSYKGTDLFLRCETSPDGSKVLLYLDEVHLQGVKLAMCWVLDTDGNLIWNGTYRLPLQALGAASKLHFDDAGRLLVETSAIALDDGNTHTKKDGSLKAEVERNYLDKVSTSVHLLFGEQFRSWSGSLREDAETTYMKLIDTPKGWYFVVGTRTGKGKTAAFNWVLGRLDAALEQTIVATGELKGPLSAVIHDAGEVFYLIAAEDDGFSIREMDLAGKAAWQGVAPLPKNSEMDDFKVLGGSLVYYRRWEKKDLKTILDGKVPPPSSAYGRVVGIPVVLVWREGRCMTTPLLSPSTKEKDLPAYAELHKEGLIMQKAYGKPDYSFVPITWE